MQQTMASTPRDLPARPARAVWLIALSVPLLPVLSWWASRGPMGEFAWWLAPCVLYGLVPLLDQLLGEDPRNPDEAQSHGLAADGWYRGVLIAWLPLHYAALVLAAWVVANETPGWIGWLGMIASLGLVAGGGINVGHELGHKRGALNAWLARLALAPACYGHFVVEHNRGHHVRVATPEDPASARLGESFWRFLPRTLLGSLRSAWTLERERLTREGKPVLHWQNQNLQGWLLSLLLAAALVAAFGWIALPLFLAQAFYGASTLEAVNYIEHYGLLRQRDASGRYERCQAQHSWNSSRRLSNWLLYQLERHADHHAHPLRPYQLLRHFEDSPQLPAGYAALVPAAWIPPLWFALMDRRVIAFYGGDRSRCNRG
ncbi:alkane 1-monooxygenase [Pseudomarimonas salicorniae]|uniref:Alkane 1-monooxygenase n=1 Tax=Pseudomarimonas salicorniae TaxID=2933270 RepID=A0ABT0GIX2_9GAMM|nr:alkane 1-monooxygenase [Lysobacter sp. CAU 1642]MCK7594496.1 alkane 1-monooxygenase [Lysobacter sp. CAU 1642]